MPLGALYFEKREVKNSLPLDLQYVFESKK
jgi:hypothetical protein